MYPARHSRFTDCRTLRTGRNEIVRVEFDKLYITYTPEAFEAGHRDNDRVEASVGEAREARIDVAAERDNLEIAIYP